MIKSNITGQRQFSQRIKLISGGYVDRVAFPDGMVTILPWDALIDEWVLKNNSTNEILFSLELFPKLCELHGCPADKMVMGDVNTIILVSRAIRYSNVIEYVPVCTECRRENKPEKVTIPQNLRRVAEKPVDYVGYDEITLPDSKDVVRISPIRVSQVKHVLARESNL